MKLQLLYFSGCPSWENAFANLQDAAVREGLTASIELVEMLDDSDAPERKFLGSPSVLVDGRDLWPETRNAYYMSCRMNRTSEAGIVPDLVDPLWNVNGIVSDNSTVGELLKGLFGYNGNPALTEVLAYLAYIAAVGWVLVRTPRSVSLQHASGT